MDIGSLFLGAKQEDTKKKETIWSNKQDGFFFLLASRNAFLTKAMN
jgi:hypothetical protein